MLIRTKFLICGILILVGSVESSVVESFFNSFKKRTVCRLTECCNSATVPFKLDNLEFVLKKRLFGQHIVIKQLSKAVISHFAYIEKSRKPLVMSFHGTTGVGKNYVSEILASILYKKGLNSKFVHVYHGTMDFTIKERLEENKIQLAEEIVNALLACPYSLFIFDEVEKMPPTIFDAITSLLDYHGTVKGADITKSIFIFIGNSAGRELAKTYHEMIFHHGMFREQTELHHFEEIAKIGAYNFAGGLQNSNAIVQSVIDHYIPFLPLERKHVAMCIKAAFEKFGAYPEDSDVEKLIDRYVAFDKNNLFALNGCKNLDKKVDITLVDRNKLTHEPSRSEL